MYDARREGEAKGEIKTLERIVVNSKLNGFSLEQIQLLSGLSVEQINEILKKHDI